MDLLPIIKPPRKTTISDSIFFTILLIIGIVYINYSWNSKKTELTKQALQIAQSVEASINTDHVLQLSADPADTSKYAYKRIKDELHDVVQINPETRFAYLYLLRDGKLFFMVDSEPKNSPDMSPPGQEFTEADEVDFLPFKSGKPQITKPITDRWGTWVSAEVPIKTPDNQTIVAVLGIDFDTSSWNGIVIKETAKTGFLIVLTLFLIVAIRSSNLKNKYLEIEIKKGQIIEAKLNKRDLQISNLLANLPGFVYRCALDENYTMKYISSTCFPITGYKPEEFMENNSVTFNDLILPEYLEEIWNYWQVVIAEKQIFEKEYRIRCKSGDIKWLWERGSGIYDENGELIYLEGYIEDITQRKLSETNLIQSEANLKRTIEESPFGIRIVSKEDVTEYANPTLLSIFGIGSLEEYNQIPTINWYLPNSKAEYLVRTKKRKNNIPVENQYEVSIQRKDKEIKHLQVFRSEILWNGKMNIQVIYLDITHRKLAENELRKLSLAIEQNTSSIFITDKNGNIEYVNPRFVEITGYQRDEIIGQNPRFLNSKKMNQEIYSELWATIAAGKIWKGELINKNKSGETYWINKSISPIFDEHGEITHYVSLAEEISDKKRQEEELIAAKEKAEESDRLKSAFLANISHEIRTPMNGIMGFAELLKEPDLSSENQLEYLDVIESSGQRMLNIINDLIDISKIEAGEATIRIRPTNLNLMLQEIHSFFLPEANKKNIRINYFIGLPEEICTIDTDPTKLNQILTNLIKNALKFTKEGSIDFGYKQINNSVEFFVSDTGAGIPAEQQEQIFERFKQSAINLTRHYEGAGLGLAISKAYVQLLGGSIRVESEIGIGSNFLFDLPIINEQV